MTATLIWLALHLGIPALLAGLIAKLPSVNAHTKSALLNKILDAVGNAAEDVLKTVLNGQDIEALFTAFGTGADLRTILSGLLPTLKSAVQTAIGPALTKALASLLGGDAAASERIVQALLSVLHDILSAKQTAKAPPQPGQVTQLADGHLLVVPHGQAIPAGSKLLVASK